MGFQLGKTFVAGLSEAKDALDDVEDVLCLATDTGFLVPQFQEPVGVRTFVPSIPPVVLLPVGSLIHLFKTRIGLQILMLADGTIG